MTEYYQYLLTKSEQYCTYQERSLHEVNSKLREWKAQDSVKDKILAHLIKEDFINEERFVRSYSIGKFRQKKWGKNKIIHELKKKKVPDLIIQIGLDEIPEEEYLSSLEQLIAKKSAEYNEPDSRKKNYKLANFAISKGYGGSLVWDIINKKK